MRHADDPRDHNTAVKAREVVHAALREAGYGNAIMGTTIDPSVDPSTDPRVIWKAWSLAEQAVDGRVVSFEEWPAFVLEYWADVPDQLAIWTNHFTNNGISICPPTTAQ